jgi:integrase
MSVKVKEKVKGSGEWWIFIDHQGKRKAKKIGNKRTAMEAAKKIEAKLTLGDFSLDDGKAQRLPTLKEYVDGWRDGNGESQIGWYEKVAVLSLKHSTYRSYRLIIDLHLIPAFGSKPINEITSRMISDLISKKVKCGIRSTTARNIKNCLSAILRHAVNPDGLIPVNPARDVPIPKPEDERQSKEQDPFTWDERLLIEETFRKDFSTYYPLVICGFRTGLRIGEIIGLQWQDIDFYQKLILVQRNITRGKITSPKSRSSNRHVRMTSQLAEVLKQHKTRMAEKTLKQGWKSKPDWVFTNEDGTPLNYGNFIHRVWNRAMDRSGLRRRTPHDMRHTYATLRLSKGDSLAEVSKEMGHATTEITYRTYYKWLPKESRSDIDALDTQPDATTRNLSATRNKKGLRRNA